MDRPGGTVLVIRKRGRCRAGHGTSIRYAADSRAIAQQAHMSSTPKYVATLSRVREVSLLGTADLGFWQKQLGAVNLAPAEFDGSARVLVSASDATFMGLRFQEL